jgi:hypothetical protein
MDHTEAAPEQAVVRRPLWEQPVTQQETVEDVRSDEDVQDGQEGQEPEAVQDVDADADDADAEAIDYPDPPRTGDADIDEAIEALAYAVSGPLEDRLTAFDAAHRTLQARLADVEG